MSHYDNEREAYQLETDYISDGTKPDLPDGTLVEYKTLLGGGVAKVENLNWDNINKVSSWRLYVHPDSQTHTKPHQNAHDELKQPDPVNHPKHYAIAPGVEAIDIIKASLTPEQFEGFLLGNFLKYRLRAGDKGCIQQDIDKSNWYRTELNKK